MRISVSFLQLGEESHAKSRAPEVVGGKRGPVVERFEDLLLRDEQSRASSRRNENLPPFVDSRFVCEILRSDPHIHKCTRKNFALRDGIDSVHWRCFQLPHVNVTFLRSARGGHRLESET
jgi:hypothetical protein